MSNPDRRLPFNEFVKVLVREREESTKDHAEWSGICLAETLVRRGVNLESLDETKREKMRKRYCVAREDASAFFQACKAAFQAELSWEHNGKNKSWT